MAHEMKSTPQMWKEAKAIALAMLREAYNREIERIAEELAPRIVSGELGAYAGDDESSPLWRLECEMRKRIARTEVDKHVVMAVSPSEDECAEGVTTLDVLRVALARGWYRPKPDDSPSARDLALPSPREVRP